MLRVIVPDNGDPAVFVFGQMGSRSLLAARANMMKVAYGSETTLSPREREGMRMRLAHMIGCSHCTSMRMARDMSGFSPDPIPEEFYSNVLALDAWDGYSVRERLAITFAERFALDIMRLGVDDAFWDALSTNFDQTEIGDLCMLSGTWTAAGFTMMALGLGDQCEVLGGRSAQPVPKMGRVLKLAGI